MPGIQVNLDGDHDGLGRRLGLPGKYIVHTTEDWVIDALEHGMQSGATSLMVMIPCKVEGVDAHILAETSLQVFDNAAVVLRAAFQEELGRPGFAKLSKAARDLLRPRFAEAIIRSIPGTTLDQANQAAEMMFDALGAGDA